MEFRHASVMLEESVQLLAPRPGGIYVDGTLGGGGHSELVLRKSDPDGLLIGFDRDADSLAAAAKRLEPFGERVKLVHSNFSALADVLSEIGIPAIDGFILDLGVSSHQLDTGERGFSFQYDAPLDMRMDQGSGRTAADLVNHLDERDLERVIKDFGEERWARRIASAIARQRETEPVATTGQLAEIVKGAIPRKFWEERIHPATRTFQALRIAVNEELESLERGLNAGLRLLRPGGRGAVISFHSLEDRIVKNTFRNLAHGCVCPKDFPLCVCGRKPEVRVLTPKPIVAGNAEVDANPRARSARLRGAEKV